MRSRRSLATHCPMLVSRVVVDAGRAMPPMTAMARVAMSANSAHAERVAADAEIVRPREPGRQVVRAERVVEHQLEGQGAARLMRISTIIAASTIASQPR